MICCAISSLMEIFVTGRILAWTFLVRDSS
jgi:hypothetical protein